MRPVNSTSNIHFDAKFKTFRLHAGDTLYAFCIGPELSLEHLYWGKYLRDGYDFRYLSQSCRNAHFNTVEADPSSFGGKIVLKAETLEEIQKTWKENRSWNALSASVDVDILQKRRLENYSWRIMSKAAMVNGRSPASSSEKTRKKSHSVTFNIHESQSQDFLLPIAKTETAPETRRRAQTDAAPPLPLPEVISANTSFSDLSAMAKLVDFSSSTPSTKGRLLEGLVNKSKTQKHHHRNIQTFDRQIGKLGKGLLCSEYTDHGTGDFRSPSFLVVDNYNGSAISPLRYRRHKIYRGKLPMPDSMPSVRCLDEKEASTLVVTMVDAGSGLEVDLIYVAMHDYDVITRRAVFRNNDKRPHDSDPFSASSSGYSSLGSSKVIQKASSLTIDFEASSSPFHCVQLSGSWARERYVIETKLNHGMHSFGSTRGVSSHQHNPFAAITIGPPCETDGEVKGFSLIYSGNFLAEAEITEMGRLRFNLGLHPMGMQWFLKSQHQAGDVNDSSNSFSTPEAVLVRSGQGLGGMSRTFHRLILERVIPSNWSDSHPPVLLNTWEAKYFHINHANVLDLAKHAASVGVDMIVLDDGWFGERNTDTVGLGDWFVDSEKFPYGLKALVDEINQLGGGMKFGLWFEPEMVSEQSLLYTMHPDWYLHVPNRPRQIGRNQMVLDFSRQDVRDYLFTMMSAVLNAANIEYIKWDMNRPLTEVYSLAAGTSDVCWQSEISHRYVLGLYDLQRRITEAFPHVLLENCASGGGRFDLGMLYYCSQIWTSDNTDSLVRVRIQYGTSLAYPARVIGSHISTVPNHITGNTARLRTRGFVAMCGTFGFELDMTIATPVERLIYQKQIEFYRAVAPIIRYGDLYRLWDPFRQSAAAWMYVTRDKKQAIVFVFCINSDHWSSVVPRLFLQGLESEAEYEVSEPAPNNLTQASGSLMLIESEVPVYQLGHSTVTLTGDILMHAGLPVRFYSSDDSSVFLLQMVTTADGHAMSMNDKTPTPTIPIIVRGGVHHNGYA